jgi:hypothetical protein
MRGKTKNKKELTLNDLAESISDLAGAVKIGFDEVYSKLGGRLDGVESRLDGINSRLDGVDGRLESIESRLVKTEDGVYDLCRRFGRLSSKVDKLEVGQEELKGIISGVYHVEIRDLKSRVGILEKKAGI